MTRFPGAPPQARQDLALAYGLFGNPDAAAAILGQDLPKSSGRDNLRFYELQRDRFAKPVGAAVITTPSKAASVPLKAVVAMAVQ